jgi:allantoin racemase
MRLLLINPNTSASITELVVRAAEEFASPGTTIVGATGRFGARYIVTRAAAAIAAHAALDAYAESGSGADAVVLACFGDPGLGALKELAAQVVGMAEAACYAAAPLGRKFAIVTGGERWGPMLEEFVASIGLSDKLARVETVAPSGADIARDPEGALTLLTEACKACVAKHGAEAVILGGAGLAGLAARLADRVPVPLIDGVQAAVAAAEARVVADLRKAHAGSHAATTPVETVGLAPPLAARMSGRTS